MSRLSSLPRDDIKQNNCLGVDHCVIVLGGLTPDIFFTKNNRNLVEDSNVASAFAKGIRNGLQNNRADGVIEAKFLGLVDAGIALGGDQVVPGESDNDKGISAAQFQQKSDGVTYF